jgi:Fur family ferric uptake transcriptional regulator
MKKETNSPANVSQTLREGGFRATTGRIRLLELLRNVGTPLSVQGITKRWKGKVLDIATLYRSLTDLSEAHIIRRIDLNTGIAHFEYTPQRPHQHHIVCSDCGRIEELEHCSLGGLEKNIATKSQYFTHIHSHSLEFFGSCTACTR